MTSEQGVRAWMATSRQVLPKQTQVTAMVATNDLVLLGTRSGRILCYQIEFGLLRSGQCLSEVGKRQGSVMQLAVLESIYMILALCDGLIHLFSLPTFSHVGVIRLDENRVSVSNAVRFITRPIFGSVEVIVATRRQLTFCKYDSTSKSFVSTKKALFVPSAPLSLSWICGKLCIGFEREFTIVDVDTGHVESLWLFESGPAFSVDVNSAHTILSCRKSAVSFSVRPDGIFIHSRVNWGDHRTPTALCVQDSLLFVSFRDHIGVFTVDDISHPIGRIDLVNVSVLLGTADVIIAGNSEAIFILRRMSNEVLQRDVFFLDKVASSDGIERELHLQNFFSNCLAVDSQHPYAQSIHAFVKSQSDLAAEDPLLVCRRIRMFMDAFAGCILEDLLANDIQLNGKHQYLVSLWISFPLFAGSLFDSVFSRFKAKHMEDDKKLADSYQRLKSTSLSQFGSSIKIEDPVHFFGSSLALLRCLPKLRSPFAMFELLSENLSNSIYKTIQDAGDGCGVSELTADEYIPILVFIVIQSGVQQLHSYVSFMSAFVSASESRGPIGYVLTTMSICLEHISNLLAARTYDDVARTPLNADTVQTVMQERVMIAQAEWDANNSK